MSKQRQNVIPGTMNVLILKAVSFGPRHGYAISRWIQDQTDDVLRVEEGVLYPALHRLERDGCLASEWGRNDTGRRAKFYTLTTDGKRRLETEVARWHRSSAAVSSIVDAETA